MGMRGWEAGLGSNMQAKGHQTGSQNGEGLKIVCGDGGNSVENE